MNKVRTITRILILMLLSVLGALFALVGMVLDFITESWYNITEWIAVKGKEIADKLIDNKK